MEKLFGTSGVRGYTNKDITPELATGIGGAVGSFFGKGATACVGRDTRKGALMLEMAVSGGLMSQGLQVVECGCVPTPVLAHYISVSEADCGIMVTGSHMPPDMIGIIPLMGDGAYIPDEHTWKIEDLYWSQKYRTTEVGEKTGVLKTASAPVDLYCQTLLSLVNTNFISKKKFRVAVDPVNGAAAGILPHILDEIGCSAEEINSEPSGAPGRSPEPRADTLTELCATIQDGRFDLGVGLDTDGDRVVFIDEQGTAVSEDVIGVMFADHVFLGVETGVFVTPVNSSGIVEWFVQSRDVLLQYCKIGQPATVKAIKSTGAGYSYEESGKYYFSRQVNWCDGILATLKVLEIMARGDMSLSEIVSFYPVFYQVKETLELPPEKKEKVMKSIEENALKILGENTAQSVKIDGCKLVYPDHSWLLLRASGTEPILRVYSDSPFRKRAKTLVNKGLQFAEQIIAAANRV